MMYYEVLSDVTFETLVKNEYRFLYCGLVFIRYYLYRGMSKYLFVSLYKLNLYIAEVIFNNYKF